MPIITINRRYLYKDEYLKFFKNIFRFDFDIKVLF